MNADAEPQDSDSLERMIAVDGVGLPVDDVAVCPVTGRVLVRDKTRAANNGIADSYVARLLPASSQFGKTPPRRATWIDPDVDDTTVR